MQSIRLIKTSTHSCTQSFLQGWSSGRFYAIRQQISTHNKRYSRNHKIMKFIIYYRRAFIKLAAGLDKSLDYLQCLGETSVMSHCITSNIIRQIQSVQQQQFDLNLRCQSLPAYMISYTIRAHQMQVSRQMVGRQVGRQVACS